ncbi:radical SAM protein [Desulfobulbus rhabdoformis]|uniref:radical SAM protein n=1 Tax=Desulfobulbus rhabdoformis TaxID=34032 RepID=UPI0019647958|nr:radical SAM protein [Desulfobulbus rhabdoformis]MBM9615552.1 radical SAM protein [Desulfobulbus rhabdoformis]
MARAIQTLWESGQLHKRLSRAQAALQACTLCPRQCGVNRMAGQLGFCATGGRAGVAGYGPHFGEEAPLVGQRGSGALFLSGCNLGCCFCQNDEISQGTGPAEEVSAEQLASIMLELQSMGCHNLNLVTPTHVVPQILEALILALEQGFHLPLVYNSSGYESLETLALLDGVVDIYLVDAKFWKPETAARYTGAADYPERMRSALLAMQAQVGSLVLDEHGSALRGLLLRHLLMPGLEAETRAILDFVAANLPLDTYINIMGQYHPCGRARSFPELNVELKAEEYCQALEYAQSLGLTRLDQPDFGRLLQHLSE